MGRRAPRTPNRLCTSCACAQAASSTCPRLRRAPPARRPATCVCGAERGGGQRTAEHQKGLPLVRIPVQDTRTPTDPDPHPYCSPSIDRFIYFDRHSSFIFFLSRWCSLSLSFFSSSFFLLYYFSSSFPSVVISFSNPLCRSLSCSLSPPSSSLSHSPPKQRREIRNPLKNEAWGKSPFFQNFDGTKKRY